MPRTLIRKIDHVIGIVLHGIMLTMLAGLLLLVAFVVITRVFSLASAGWTDELIEFMFAWLIFSGTASLWREKGHFAVTLIADTVKSERLKVVAAVTSELLCLAFLIVFTYQSCVLIASAGGEASPVFSLPRIYWYASLPVAGVIMIAYSIARLIQRAAHRPVHDPHAAELSKYEV
jgi:TRAP-type transport system small permease protein